MHLKVLKASFLLEAMDYHFRAGYLEPEEDNAPLPTSTGQPEMYDDEWSDSLPGSPKSSAVHAQVWIASRILFGYISSVCPMLEDLKIWPPDECSHGFDYHPYHPKLQLHLERGVCLLSRLEHLRRLQINSQRARHSIKYDRIDLNWMALSGHQDKYKKRRQRTVEGWKDAIAAEALLEKRRREYDHIARFQIRSAEGTVESELIELIENLDLLTDVKAMVEEMNGQDFSCLPDFERLSFSSAMGPKLWHAVRRQVRKPLRTKA
ncbi:hypothetical protein BGX23_001108 [Mortierella sp. AD031]|nr:hypothetical protein BGX23_001108 [Mortierella sp. AD031]